MSFEKPWGNYLLEKIIETPAPDAVSLWPETIAWQILLVCLIAYLLIKTYNAWKNYQANIYRREALQWLEQCSLTNEDDVRQFPALIKKAALLANELTKTHENQDVRDSAIARHNDISLLSGSEWALWLDKHCTKTHFSQANKTTNMAELLKTLAYAPSLNFNDDNFIKAINELYQQIHLWVQHHDVSKSPMFDTHKSKGENND